MNIVFVIHIICTFLSISCIWLLQIVHYPLLKFIPDEAREKYHDEFKMKMTLYTLVFMTLEVFTGITTMLVFSFNVKKEGENSFLMFLISVLMLLFTHFITFRMIRPMLKKLSTKYSDKLMKELLGWNWVRTSLWTIRGIIILITLFAK